MKILSTMVIGAFVILGLAGCAQTPPTAAQLDSKQNLIPTTQTPATPEVATYQKPGKIQGSTSIDTTGIMTNSRFYVVVINKEIPELSSIAQRIATRVNASEVTLMSGIKGFSLTTSGSVLTSDILRDPDIKLVLFGGNIYTPPAVTKTGTKLASDKKAAKSASKPSNKSKATAKKSTPAKKSSKSAKPTTKKSSTPPKKKNK
jgi:hypothetical protein